MSKKKRERKYGSDETQAATAAAGSEMTKFYWILGAVAVLGVGIIMFRVGSTTFSNTVTAPVEVEGLEDPQTLMTTARGVTKGNPDAEITILEFADFQCPGCRQFHAQVKPLVEAEFIATGVAKFVYYDFPLVQAHPNAFLASRAARCAEDQGKFWEFHDVLFRQQNSWSPQPSPVGTFENYAGDLGLDAGAFSTCVRSDMHADVVTANMELGYQMQVPATPTIVVGKGQSVPLRVESSIEGIRRAVASLQTPTTGG
jgi:protein-disulfide isomerase